MTAYNRERFIGEAIESVMKSTFQQWELIILDDRSKDTTVDIAKSPGLSLISRKAFDAVGGFSEKRMISDFDMWHKLSCYSLMILMPGNMVHIRQHEGQEVQHQQTFVVQYEKIKLHYLQDKNCPLSTKQVQIIKTKRRNTAFKIAIRKLLKLNVKAAFPRLRVVWFYLWH